MQSTSSHIKSTRSVVVAPLHGATLLHLGKPGVRKAHPRLTVNVPPSGAVSTQFVEVPFSHTEKYRSPEVADERDYYFFA